MVTNIAGTNMVSNIAKTVATGLMIMQQRTIAMLEYLRTCIMTCALSEPPIDIRCSLMKALENRLINVAIMHKAVRI